MSAKNWVKLFSLTALLLFLFIVVNIKYSDTNDTEAWYGKVLEPTKMESYEIPPIHGSNSVYSDKVYKISYYTSIGTIYEEMVVRRYIGGPSALDSSGGDFMTKLYIQSQKTYTDNKVISDNSSNFKIGSKGDITIEAYIQPGDAIRSVKWSRQYMQKSPRFKIFDNSDINLVTQADVKYENAVLDATDDTFDVIFAIGHYHTEKEKSIDVKWTYDVYNVYDLETHHEESTLTFYYYSE
ncbi:hypothetical protein [Longirhabdus pacifica]|uniref:hypothetical protein n=1 Tax=Longirhabdus pacifica TaxID=2305227 RepID=UPI0010090861|nr:hypothetical protein [Longirhabdus pacifica]